MTRRLVDDRGSPVVLDRPPRRVVSLVPSLTEAIAVTAPERLVGATEWCTHPAGLDVVRVRGTKNPDRRAITDLRPDLVVANQEENRRLDIDRLRAAGVPVWVTVIESVDDALRSMGRVFDDVLDVGTPGWLLTAAEEWRRPDPQPELRAIVPIWRDPWMVVGARTFTGDVLSRLGLVNQFAEGEQRYPHVDLARLQATAVDVVLLPGRALRLHGERRAGGVPRCSHRPRLRPGPDLVRTLDGHRPGSTAPGDPGGLTCSPPCWAADWSSPMRPAVSCRRRASGSRAGATATAPSSGEAEHARRDPVFATERGRDRGSSMSCSIGSRPVRSPPSRPRGVSGSRCA